MDYYYYQCLKCGRIFKMQDCAFDRDSPEILCPGCKSKATLLSGQNTKLDYYYSEYDVNTDNRFYCYRSDNTKLLDLMS